MTVGELIAKLQKFDPNLHVGLFFECKWRDLDERDIELVRGSDDWGQPKDDSVQLDYF